MLRNLGKIDIIIGFDRFLTPSCRIIIPCYYRNQLLLQCYQ